MSTATTREATVGVDVTVMPNSDEAALASVRADLIAALAVVASVTFLIMPSMLTDADVTVRATSATGTDTVSARAVSTAMTLALPDP